jgi:hypothetical protein
MRGGVRGSGRFGGSGLFSGRISPKTGAPYRGSRFVFLQKNLQPARDVRRPGKNPIGRGRPTSGSNKKKYDFPPAKKVLHTAAPGRPRPALGLDPQFDAQMTPSVRSRTPNRADRTSRRPIFPPMRGLGSRSASKTGQPARQPPNSAPQPRLALTRGDEARYPYPTMP